MLTSTYTVATNVEGALDSTEDAVSGPISSVQTLEYNSNQNGTIRSAATAMTQGVPDGPGSFSFSAGDIGASTERPAVWPSPSAGDGPFGGVDANVTGTVSGVDPQAKVSAGSLASFSVTFELGIGEVRQANFAMNYTIDIANGDNNTAAVAWELQAPDMSPLFRYRAP